MASAAPEHAARTTDRGLRRRRAIVSAAAELFARHGYHSVGMDDIGAAAGVTGPAIYRHFDSKSTVLAAVFDGIIDAVEAPAQATGHQDPAARLEELVAGYATAVAQRRELMAVFVREVHHLPEEQAQRLRHRQRDLVARWRALLAEVHPGWPAEQVRTAVHAVFGMLNAVGTFSSPLPDDELANQLTVLAAAALHLPSLSGRATATGNAAARRR